MLFGKKAEKYYKKHPWENSIAHIFVGAGVGFLLTYPLAQTHPLRWGVACLVIGVGMHLWAASK